MKIATFLGRLFTDCCNRSVDVVDVVDYIEIIVEIG